MGRRTPRPSLCVRRRRGPDLLQHRRQARFVSRPKARELVGTEVLARDPAAPARPFPCASLSTIFFTARARTSTTSRACWRARRCRRWRPRPRRSLAPSRRAPREELALASSATPSTRNWPELTRATASETPPATAATWPRRTAVTDGAPPLKCTAAKPDAGRPLQQEDGQARVAEEPAGADRHVPGSALAASTRSFRVLYRLPARTAIIPGTTEWCATAGSPSVVRGLARGIQVVVMIVGRTA